MSTIKISKNSLERFKQNPKNPTHFWVEYNAKFIADYKTVRGCLNFIQKIGLHDDSANVLRIVDNNGDEYHPITGNPI